MFADMRPMFLNALEHRTLSTCLKTKTTYQIYGAELNPLRTKLYLSDIKTPFVPRSKHVLPLL
jgi:hypothetical protein